MRSGNARRRSRGDARAAVADEPARSATAIDARSRRVQRHPGRRRQLRRRCTSSSRRRRTGLSYWRTASHEINYRRFFDINTLAGLRVEDPTVFEATHQLLAQLIREGKVTGVRIDHPDGLFDPARYFAMLQDWRPTRGASDGDRRRGPSAAAVRGRREDPVRPRAAAGAAGRSTAPRATTT